MFEAYATYLVASEGVTYLSQNGTLTVTAKTPERLQGTFAMTLNNPAAAGGENTLEVTDGEFDVTNRTLP